MKALPPRPQTGSLPDSKTVDSDSRVTKDELKALLSGGTVASIFAYLTFLNAQGCTLQPPFEMLGHSDLGVGYFFAPLILVTFIFFLVHLALLSMAYGITGNWTDERSMRRAKWAWRWADKAFAIGVVAIIAIGVAIPLRVVEYFLSGGHYPADSKDVKACLDSMRSYLNGTGGSPLPP